MSYGEWTASPKCPKCTKMNPSMQYRYPVLADRLEFLILTCNRCGYTWTMNTVTNRTVKGAA